MNIIKKIWDITDSVLSKITMYKLVLWSLIGWLVIGAGLSVLGYFPFTPAALAYSTLIILAVSWLTNKLFARIFETHENVESIYITAFILALIISPPHSTSQYLTDLPILIWAPILAMASKYILAIGKKHIFNPAAIAVAITSFALGQSASWWVGTLPMLPFVFIGGLLVVKKIQRFDLVIAFVIASLAVIFYTAPAGVDPISLLKGVLVVSPIVFFGFIMLTEPLTTPPTRWRRIIYGLFVGSIYAPTVHIGGIYSTPELALCVGNILSYALSPKGKYILTLVGADEIASHTAEFSFVPDRPIRFRPGQYMEWTLAHKEPDSRGNRRYFTIASSPTEKEVRLGIKFYKEPSSFKKTLANLKDGSTVMAGQLSGDFVLPRDTKKKLAFLAGGIGITPFRSMIKYVLDKGEKRDMVMIYSNKLASEIAYADILDDARKRLKMATAYTLTDMSRLPKGWDGCTGFIDAEMIAREIPDYRHRIFYISGPQPFVAASSDMLRNLGVPFRRIKTDFFPGLA